MHPIRDRDGSDVTSLSAQVNDSPMSFTLLKVADSEAGEFTMMESACEQHGKQCPITFALHPLMVRRLPECLALFGTQPITKPDTQFLYALDSPYSCGYVGAE